MTNSIDEFEKADVILVTGSNTTEAHPVIAAHIKRAVIFNKTKLIIVDPRKIDLVRFSTKWLRQNSGTDVAWINGLLHVIIKEGLHDQSFIDDNCENFDALKEIVKKYTPKKVEEITGIPARDIIEAARIYANARRASIVYAMGITQHANGTDNVKSLANLAMCTANIGKEGTGVNPLRGQNNVQGACDMGALPNVYPGYQKVLDENAKVKFEKAWDTKLSGDLGLTIIEIMNAACSKDLKALYIMGENPMVSDPNLNHVKEAFESLDFIVVQDIFLTETAKMADVVFPACTFAEKDGTNTNTERRVLRVNKIIDAPGEAREDWRIIQSLALALGNAWNYTSHKDIQDEINKLVPQYGGITHKRIMNNEKLQWPCPHTGHKGTKYLHKGGFIRGKGLFSAVDHIPAKEQTNKEYPFAMSTGRMLFHYHTGSMTRRTKALNIYQSKPYVEMNIKDIENLNLKHGDKVRISSRRGTIESFIKETDKVRKGDIFIPFHFSEAAANMLTNDALDPVAKIPELKICAVKIESAKS